MSTSLPDDESARAAALRGTSGLDTTAEQDFDDIAVLASQICGTPVGLVNLLDEDRQWFSRHLPGTPQEVPFCSHTVAGAGLLEVPDATRDARFSDTALVTGDAGFHFYAGAAVIIDGQHAVGTVGVLDRQPRVLDAGQKRALHTLARHVGARLELHRCARRTGEIADRLRQLDRMKESFLAGVSHELRTPLTSIRGYLEVLLDDDFDPRTARRFLSVMQQNSDRLMQLVDDLLTVARLSDDGPQVDVAEIDLTALAHEAIAAYRPLAEQRHVELRDRAADRTPALGDTRQLSQALHHLLGNAIKFTPAGGEVTVSTGGADAPELVVTDTGVGIPAADLPHLFDRFFRGAEADTMAAPGSGLGLAIVRSIVDAHHGHIHVTSEVGAGTTVRLSLPAAR